MKYKRTLFRGANIVTRKHQEMKVIRAITLRMMPWFRSFSYDWMHIKIIMQVLFYRNHHLTFKERLSIVLL